MGLVSLHSPTAGVTTRLLLSSPRPSERSSIFGRSIATSRFTRSSSSSRRSARNLRPLASGTTYQKTTKPLDQEIYSKDADSVFVAGATGKVGSRTVRELLKLGFRVRAGVRSAQRAETLVQSVRQMKLDASIGSQPMERLEIVECDLENQGVIAPAIGSASIVICCIGASEKEVFDVTGPYRIDYQATKNLIESATSARVDHFILLTSLGTNKIGFPAAILNLFWGVLIWKRKAEEALIASGLPYTIVRPGGMERPTDSYKETHNIVLANEDTYFGGQVSNLQVAELMAFMATKRRSSLYKVVEVIAETTAPLTPMEMLLAKIPPQREIPSESQPDSITVAKEETSQMTTVKKTPLSPYWAYEDLKPPTSPTPTRPSATIAKEKIADATRQPSEPNMQVVAEKLVFAKTTPGLSPYTAYDDLRPPTSPSPSAPGGVH